MIEIAAPVRMPGRSVGGRNALANIASADFGYWRHAPWLTVALAALVAVRVHEFLPALRVLKPVFFFSVIGAVLLYIKSAQSVRSNLLRQRLSVLVYLYLAAVVVSIPFALWQGGAFVALRGLVPPVLLYSAFALCRPRRDVLDRMAFWYLLVNLLFAANLQVFGRVFGGRLQSTIGFYDSNDFASVMAVALPFGLAILTRASGWRRTTGALLAVAVLIMGIVASGSRGGTLAMAAGALVFLAGHRGGKGLVLVVLMAFAAAITWFTAPPTFKTRMLSLAHLENDYNTTDELGRKAVWRRGRQYIREHPMFGVGAGNFEIAEGQYNEEVGRTGKWSAPHNAYLQAFAELGIGGGLIFLAMLLTAAGIARQMWRPNLWARGPPLHRPEYLSSLVAFAVGAYFLSQAYFNPLFALLGFIALAQRTMEVEALVSPLRVSGARGLLAHQPSGKDVPARTGAQAHRAIQQLGGRPGFRGGLAGYSEVTKPHG